MDGGVDGRVPTRSTLREVGGFTAFVLLLGAPSPQILPKMFDLEQHRAFGRTVGHGKLT